MQVQNICVITGTRAEYGLLKPLMTKIKENPNFELKLLVTGAHLSPEFALTYKLIEEEGFIIDEKIEMLLSADTSSSIVKSMGVAMIGLADAFSRMNPDVILILGDRYEMLSVASAAAAMKIPIIHLSGGDITEGAYDDAFRHAITKLSHLHFTSTDEYRNRVIQMGEQPDCVFNVGAIGIDNVLEINLLSKEELERELKIKFQKYNYQVTFHPETLSEISAEEQFQILLDVIKNEEDSFFIFTKANADTNGRIINKMIDDFVIAYPNKSKAFTSLGTLRFLSVLKYCDAIVGNSSSGIVEAPSLKTATINIGNRQKGRTQAKSVINTPINRTDIKNAFDILKNESFRALLPDIINPYGEGNTAEKIISILEKINFKTLLIKRFNNLY
ncbi:UDP-N-acetylglucosamine 2-epimerase [Elizabethkingia anophelis]|uniref:UDP-N-acetylglucosamine 2-epimerase n=1 Tax=Elizabethkingia anophelis TaxID=1117645 RepID=UPI00099A419A|nr:UDP-N-acetylglucosamine 2-epimerase [Elizabethkingia anophelis]MCT4223067.1 UDP-N-acetylglucosamine 2-epimerase (hydrolyzing) [Elizabethkingia anophelis]MCT4330836.1 UDP-N-acetylglucosamine 2-epimerase (hydrolyzing) [Elizabethkingia anophelis]MDV3865655.1 UDP-N-acetylglucosamine 2-epimerase (hydrolyzing) [Elizabethkingia anophelis]MYY26418.1 UDP-N-acetylglucosamine 2-epimerase (hydrolyzing) [Elizabethkingia anophelis]OPC46274.1 UDP-N-acetyl-D-glucosamine 2-epimerase, UDP-hydrolysing [Elizab